jgi:hypothetical protein
MAKMKTPVPELEVPETTEFQVPESLAACADLLYTTREMRLDIEKQVDALKQRETQLREHLINTLPKGEASGIAGRIARVAIVVKEEPQVQDWDAFYGYIKEHDAFDLLQKRMSAPAVKARWQEDETVAGVGVFNNVTISLRKV